MPTKEELERKSQHLRALERKCSHIAALAQRRIDASVQARLPWREKPPGFQAGKPSRMEAVAMARILVRNKLCTQKADLGHNSAWHTKSQAAEVQAQPLGPGPPESAAGS